MLLLSLYTRRFPLQNSGLQPKGTREIPAPTPRKFAPPGVEKGPVKGGCRPTARNLEVFQCNQTLTVIIAYTLGPTGQKRGPNWPYGIPFFLRKWTYRVVESDHEGS